ncbi:DUF881 domain-containing protein [Clostridium sp. ATCC 25772]|uniref:DUF881 domain-containing protein n=1 Tax=Clostridium senegalense TaxID=1465809 RepID=A0A6M0GYG6_9CLOT|nr:DUF881 domain-containing protein [Clostridium sp. ATCC 25772]NEU03540.1 DUF881 domain-containing protein [Clostridium senegalense]
MRNNEATLFVFIASIIVGVLISMNIEIGDNTRYLDMDQYEEAYNEKANLQRDIISLQDQLNFLENKIKKYEESSYYTSEVMQEIDKELNDNKLLLGTSKVKGEGIKITLNDAPQVAFGQKYTSDMLIHDKDIIKVINELRNAGAEAIAVNDYRVVSSSYGFCAGSNINVGGIKVVAPFYITAIGNKDVMENYLTTQENHVKALKRRECYVDIETLSSLEIPAYSGIIKNNYLTENMEK